MKHITKSIYEGKIKRKRNRLSKRDVKFKRLKAMYDLVHEAETEKVFRSIVNNVMCARFN